MPCHQQACTVFRPAVISCHEPIIKELLVQEACRRKACRYQLVILGGHAGHTCGLQVGGEPGARGVV